MRFLLNATASFACTEIQAGRLSGRPLRCSQQATSHEPLATDFFIHIPFEL